MTSTRVGGRDGAVEAGAVADGLADRFVQQRGHARGGGARGEAARLQHQDAPVAAPGRVEQCERDDGGLAGAGRGDQHGVAVGGEGREEGRQGFGDRQGGERRHGEGCITDPAACPLAKAHSQHHIRARQRRVAQFQRRASAMRRP